MIASIICGHGRPSIVARLSNFNDDKSLVKDVMRYKTRRRPV